MSMPLGKHQVLEVGSLTIDPNSYRAWFDGGELALSVSQIELLAFLIANGHRVVSREELADVLDLKHRRSVDVLLVQIRKALGREFVRTVRGRGWILTPDSLTAN